MLYVGPSACICDSRDWQCHDWSYYSINH